jgi:hypothetical protein
MDNLGSFGAAAGGMSPELQEAMQRRAGGPTAGTSAQVTQGAPGASPMPQGAPQGMPPQGLPPQMGTATGNQGPAIPIDSSEAKIIIQALTTRLKALSGMQAGPPAPTPTQGGM